MTRLLPLACLVALAGCRPDEEIRTYTVPKPTRPPAPVVRYVDVTGDKDRLLGALVPAADGKFLSVKLLGPKDAVAPHAAAFRRLAESLRLSADPARPLTFALPDGWTKGPAKQMRQDTLLTDGPSPLDVGVFQPIGGSLLENVNRWRGQVGAANLTEADLPAAVPELKFVTP